MDNMRLEGELVKKAGRALIRRHLRKKYGVDVNVNIKDLFINYSDGRLNLSCTGSADIDQTSAWKIISTLLSAGGA